MILTRWTGKNAAAMLMIMTAINVATSSPIEKSNGTQDVWSEAESEEDNSIDDKFKDLDTQLNQHLLKAISELKYMIEENSQLKMNPLELDEQTFKPIIFGQTFDIHMQNIQVKGLADFEVTDLTSQSEDSRVKVGVLFPKLTVTHSFNANGTMFDVFNVEGDGNATLEFSQVHARTILYLTRSDKHLSIGAADQPYVDFSSASVRFSPDGQTQDNIASQFGPILFWMLTGSVIEKIDHPIFNVINGFMERFVIPEFYRAISLPVPFLRVHVPQHPVPYAYVSPMYMTPWVNDT